MKKIIVKTKIWSGKLFRMMLRKFYRFDRWHIFTLTERHYAKDIITYCNTKNDKNAFCEIGCGLGDIIRNVQYKDKYGYDSDPKVLKAAAMLNRITFKKKIHFSVFHFPESPLTGKFDVIVLVNWIHHIKPDVLKYKLEEYFRSNLNTFGSILIDTVQDKEYEFNHNIHYLAKDIKATLTMLGNYERQRQVWIINKI